MESTVTVARRGHREAGARAQRDAARAGRPHCGRHRRRGWVDGHDARTAGRRRGLRHGRRLRRGVRGSGRRARALPRGPGVARRDGSGARRARPSRRGCASGASGSAARGRRGVRGRSGAPPADRRGVARADDGPAPARARARRVRRRHARPAPGDRRRDHPRSRRGGLGLPGGRPAGARAGRRCAHRDRRPRRRTRPRRSLQGARGQRPHPVGQRVRPGGVGGCRGGGADPRAPRGRGRVAAHGAARLHGGHEPRRGGRARPAHRRARQLRLVRAQAPRGGRGSAPRAARRAAAPRRAAGAARRRARPRGLPPHRRGSPARRRRAAHRTSRSCCSSRCAPGRSAS